MTLPMAIDEECAEGGVILGGFSHNANLHALPF
jgi:hypothetical protein